MITIIHGDDRVLSRKKLEEIVLEKKDREKILIDGKRTSFLGIKDACESLSLFTSLRIIVIENFLTGIISKEKQEIVEYLCGESQSDILLWEDRKIESSKIKKLFPRAQELRCQLPSLLFSFLDDIGVLPSSSILRLFHAVLKNVEPEQVHAMLLRQFRYLILVKDFGNKEIPGLASWQAGKFRKQARGFTLDRLIKTYRQLVHMDYQIKTGATVYPLASLLDIFLVTL